MDYKTFTNKILDSYYSSVFQIEFAQKAEYIIHQYQQELNAGKQ